MKRLISVVDTCLLCVSVYGQQSTPQALDLIRSSPGYQQAVLRTYQSYESGLSTHCEKIDLDMATRQAKVYGAMQTDDNGDIVSGVWKELTQGVACGEKRLYAALVIIKAGKPGVYSLLPGYSYASPLLQHDAMQYVSIGAMVGKGCALDVIDTILPSGEPKGSGIPWDEKWTVRGCGKRYLVTVHFLPDETGTTIHVSPQETVALR